MIEFPGWGDRSELSHLWQLAFDDQPRAVRFFFQNRFRPEDCLVCRKDGKIIAALYLLPTSLTIAGIAYQAHYIYAAATLPEHRGKGYMTALLEAAGQRGWERGDAYSAVLPATEPLCRFYEKAGYVPYYKAVQVAFIKQELSALTIAAHLQTRGRLLPDFNRLSATRNARLTDREGSLQWDAAALAYAAGYSRVFGGDILVLQNYGRMDYALYEMDGKDCMVTELVSEENGYLNFGAELLRRVPAAAYHFRLPAGKVFLGKSGITENAGMLRPLGNRPLIQAPLAGPVPYLGLALS